MLINISQNLLLDLKKAVEEGIEYTGKYNNPYPGIVTEKIIEALEGIELDTIIEDKSKNLVLEIITNLWKYHEIKKRVIGNNSFEKDWLKDLKNEYSQKITKSIKHLTIENYELGIHYENYVSLVINDGLSFSKEEFTVQFMLDLV